jgi:hypothetical protein
MMHNRTKPQAEAVHSCNSGIPKSLATLPANPKVPSAWKDSHDPVLEMVRIGGEDLMGYMHAWESLRLGSGYRWIGWHALVQTRWECWMRGWEWCDTFGRKY